MMDKDRKSVERAIDTVRILSAEAVQEAESGHPGLPMGCADYAFTLWYKFMRHSPARPDWIGRDRFVLSAGHGSMLLYSLLHLFEYDLSMDELRRFRQLESKTPGHPEYGLTPGVEVTTGPLGTGFATSVGLAIAGKQFAARMGDEKLFDQHIFVLSSDGCMMEGITHEAASLAGHNRLDNLICFYDDNHITIEGSTDLAFSDDVGARFESYGWNVIRINGQNIGDIEDALAAATAHSGSPTLIAGRTEIGYGSPNKAGDASVHGAPLGKDELMATKKALGFDPDRSFHVDDEVRNLCSKRAGELNRAAKQWDGRLRDFLDADPEKKELFESLMERRVPEDILQQLLEAAPQKPQATRVSGGAVMQKASAIVPALAGGSADLAPSTKTLIDAESSFSAVNPAGRNLHFGVREFAMSACGNGMALHGSCIPYVATFAVFSDFMKPALRLAAIQKLHVVFVLTHDSIFVGEDGPTHQPIEQIAMLRAMPGMTVIRPAETNEVAHAWAAALTLDGPVALFLTRQTVPDIPDGLLANIDLARGAYVLSDDPEFDTILIATGSEVMECLEAAGRLRDEGRKIRVVSMPSRELFESQDDRYRRKVLPPECRRRVVVEAAATFGWHRYAGDRGLVIGIDHFGESAPYGVLAERYGFTADAITQRVQKYMHEQ